MSHSPFRSLAVCAALGLSLAIALAAPVAPDRAQPDAVAEARKAAAGFRVPAGVQTHLFAAEPLLANPVAFNFDERGRCYVAETYRHSDAVTDNRRHMQWLDDDLASRSVADRVAMYRRHLGAKFTDYEKPEDRVKLVVDSNGDGSADTATVFADGFRDAADGIGAGILARRGDVYYACIPTLWKLRDTTGDGVADQRDALSTGYGIHVAFIGHDLHGLTIGPDGRLYFSIGDRGLNVVTKEGRRLELPGTGAVLRCELDGRGLELFATGLRNPQELAFDAHGNLFTCDNNCDAGDKSRWVYLVPGSDSGWRIGYQYGSRAHWGTPLGNRGPWNSERLWDLPHPGQAAYIVPPLAHLADGPSGLCYHPGVAALPDDQVGRFFLADFRGGAGNSGVWSVAVQPKGPGFEITDRKQYIWSVLATDVEIGPDGGLYVSDWLEGWNKTGKGRIWRFADNEKLASPAVQEVKRLLAEDLTKRPAAELAGLLGHADRRVRQEAQFALVAANDRARLMAVATGDQDLPRRHGIWGLGQLVRQGDGEATAALVRLLTHSDDEVRAQAARTLGDSGQGRRPELLPLLADRSPRVRLLAALAVRPGDDPVPTRDALTQMLRDNADAEPLLRHAGAMGLSHLPTESLTAVNDPAPAVRMGLLLALRRQSHPAVAAFLSDPEPRLVVEAARAINDLPIEAALPTLAALVERPGLDESLGLRVLNAHFRLGQPENAAALARLAARSDVADWLRAEAIDMLGSWAKPGRRDRVTGLSMSLPERESAPAVAAFREQLVGLFSGSDSVRQAAVKAAAALGVKEVGPVLTRLVADEKQPAATRAEALTALAALNDGRTDDLVRLALAADAPTLRIAGRRVLAQRQPAEALPLLIEAAEKATIPERQAAIDGLATLKARDALASWAERLLAGEVPPELRLEVREALEKQPSLKAQAAKYVAAQPKDDPLRDWRDSLLGGDANRGRELFVGKTALACQRCHKIEGQGGEVGPDLTAIASQQPRDYLLEAIVLPNKAIAKGFESVAVLTADGKTYFGVLKGEDETTLRLVTADGQLVTLAKDEIDERRAGPSAMPADLIKHISPREMRDLVAYLATLKGPAK